MKIKIINFNEQDKTLLTHYIDEFKYYIDKMTTNVIFLYLSNDNIQSRKLLRETIIRNPDNKIIISSNKHSLANLAWKVDVFSYIESPIINQDLKSIFHKLMKYIKNKNNLIKLTFQGGFDLINPSDIRLIQASGNYVELYTETQTKKIYTYKLKELEEMLQQYPYLIRTGRSFILNIDKISVLERNYVKIKGEIPIKLKLSNNYIKKIKQILLWYI